MDSSNARVVKERSPPERLRASVVPDDLASWLLRLTYQVPRRGRCNAAKAAPSEMAVLAHHGEALPPDRVRCFAYLQREHLASVVESQLSGVALAR